MTTTFNETASELALVATRLAAEPAHPHAVPWQTALRQSLASTLSRGQDDLLARTLEQCRGSRSAFEIVRRAGIDAVECPEVVHRGNRTRARLMLLPIHCLDGSGLRFGRLPRGAGWAELRERITQAAVARGAPAPDALLLADYLYHPEELRGQPASAVLRSAQAVIDLSGGMAVSRGALLQSGAPAVAQREAARGGGQLGYLLAVGILPVDVRCDADLMPDPGVVDDGWLDGTAAIVAALLERSPAALSSSPLAGFHQALRIGEQRRRVLQFLRDVPSALARAGAGAEAACVLAAIHANEDAAEVRLSLCVVGQVRLLLKTLHRCEDVPAAEAILATIDTLLARIGIAAVRRGARTLRLEPGVAGSDDLRRRRFPMPATEPSRAETV